VFRTTTINLSLTILKSKNIIMSNPNPTRIIRWNGRPVGGYVPTPTFFDSFTDSQSVSSSSSIPQNLTAPTASQTSSALDITSPNPYPQLITSTASQSSSSSIPQNLTAPTASQSSSALDIISPNPYPQLTTPTASQSPPTFTLI